MRLSGGPIRFCVSRGFRSTRDPQRQDRRGFPCILRDNTVGHSHTKSMCSRSSGKNESESALAEKVGLAYKPESEVLIASSFGSQHIWKERLEHAGLTVRVPGDDCSKVEIGIVFNHPPGALDQCENLKAVQSLGAGVDFMMEDPDIVNRGVPLMRIVDPLMAERMSTFCVWAVTNIQRKCDAYYMAQMESRWDKGVENYKNIDNQEVSIGVMGLGVMGGKVAKTLSMLGYKVHGWTRTKKTADCLGPGFDTVALYHGDDAFLEFGAASQIIINLLPLTEQTKGILSSRLFQIMPRGGSIMNLARGAHLVANDLLDALDKGQLDHAVLDVFVKEPLPPTCPFWKHPKIRVFPHMSSVTDIPNGVEQILRNRQLILSGQTLPPGVQAQVENGY